MGYMTKRPQTFIRETIIKPFRLFGRKPYPSKGILGFFRRNTQAVILINRLTISIAVTLSDPGSSAGFQNRLDGSHESARGGAPFNPFVAANMLVGLAVRNH